MVKYSLPDAVSPSNVLFVVVLASMVATLTRTEAVPRFSDPDQIPDRWQIAGPDNCSRPGLGSRRSPIQSCADAKIPAGEQQLSASLRYFCIIVRVGLHLDYLMLRFKIPPDFA